MQLHPSTFHIVTTSLPKDHQNISAAIVLCSRVNEESMVIARSFAEREFSYNVSAPRIVIEELLSRFDERTLTSLQITISEYPVVRHPK